MNFYCLLSITEIILSFIDYSSFKALSTYQANILFIFLNIYISFSFISFYIYVEQMNTAYALYKGFWEALEKALVIGMN